MMRKVSALAVCSLLFSILWFGNSPTIRAADCGCALRGPINGCKSPTLTSHDLPYGTPTTPICRPIFFSGDPMEDSAIQMVSVIRLSPVPTGKPKEPPPQRPITREPVRSPRIEMPDLPREPDIKPPDMPRDPTLPPKPDSSAKLHLLLLADNEAQDTGKTNAAGAQLFEQLLKAGIRSERIASVVKLTSPEMDADGIIKKIADLPVKPDDSLVVYYAGAAVFDENDSAYMLTPAKSEKKLPREDVRRAIAAKKARFSVLLTDPAAYPVIAEPQGKPQTPAPGAAALESLFFGYRGFVDMHGATDGEFASARGNYGGAFTIAFVREFGRPAGTWADLLEGVKFTTNNLFKSYRLEVLKSDDVPAPAKTRYRNQESQVPVLLTPIDNVAPAKAGAAMPTLDRHVIPVGIPVERKPAIIGVKMPATARLSINGQPTAHLGVERRFETSALATNAAQDFDLQVELNGWTGLYRIAVAGGQTVMVELQVP